MDKPHNAPWFARQILQLSQRGESGESLSGDLLEEFSQRSEQDRAAARRWFWRQTLLSLKYSLEQWVHSPQTLKTILMVIPLLIVPALFGFICWLSAMDSMPSTVENGWQKLIQGQVHSLLLEPLLWPEYLRGVAEFEWSMFIDVKSVIWAALVISALNWMGRGLYLSAQQYAFRGFILAFLPYIGGLAVIITQQPVPQKVGPILAFMLISLIYLLPAVSLLSWRYLKKVQHCE